MTSFDHEPLSSRATVRTWPAYRPSHDRFLVFRARSGCGGLGDRVVGIISPFVLALVTQRQFRIDWTSPVPLKEAWEPASSALAWDRADWPAGELRELLLVDRLRAAANYFGRKFDWLRNDCPPSVLRIHGPDAGAAARSLALAANQVEPGRPRRRLERLAGRFYRCAVQYRERLKQKAASEPKEGGGAATKRRGITSHRGTH